MPYDSVVITLILVVDALMLYPMYRSMQLRERQRMSKKFRRTLERIGL